MSINLEAANRPSFYIYNAYFVTTIKKGTIIIIIIIKYVFTSYANTLSTNVIIFLIEFKYELIYKIASQQYLLKISFMLQYVRLHLKIQP